MYFLRTNRRNGITDRIWIADSTTAQEKARALRVLGREVLLTGHPYLVNPQSAAGNCWCGKAQQNTIHDVVIDER